MNTSAAEEWFRRGLACLRERRFEAAAAWLARADEQDHAEARHLLGTLYLNGAGVAYDPARAAELFAGAAAAGSAAAHYALANLALAGIGGPRDEAAARQALLAAARAGFPPAWRALAFVLDRLQPAERWRQAAEQCLAHAAARGDLFAQYLLGMRLCAQPARQTEAAAWLAQAARRGLQRAAVALQRSGLAPAATPPPVAAPDLPELDWPSFTPPAERRLSAQPAIGYCDDVLTPSECEYLICLAEPQLRPSQTLDPRTGEGVANSLRTSYSTNLHPAATDVVLELIRLALAAVAGLPVAHAEPLAILRYQSGQEYKPHYDYFTAEALSREPRLSAASGQRVVTTFAYLSDVERGGGTGFPRLDFKIEPRLGRVVRMENCDASGAPDPRTLHAGLPVEAGEKWLVTLWFRANPFVLS